MKKKVKGIVLEKNKNRLIILTPEGDYLKVPHPGGKVRRGDEIWCRPSVTVWPKAIAAAASMAAVFLVIFTIFLDDLPWISPSPGEVAYGYLAMDINPSVELAFNRDQKVFAYRALDEEDEWLLEDFPEGASLHDAVEWLLERSAYMELIRPEAEYNLVLVSLVGKDADTPKIEAKRIHDTVNQKLESMDLPAYVAVFESDGPSREKAKKEGLSLNRYLLVEALQKQGSSEVSRDAPMVEVMTELEEMPSNSVTGTTGKPETLPEIPVDQGRPSKPGTPGSFNGDRKPTDERPGVGQEGPVEGVPPKPGVPEELPAQGEDKRRNNNNEEGDPPAQRP